MSEKIRKKIPYSNTKVPAEKTKAKLELLLRSYGIQKIGWANDGNEEVLVFDIVAKVQGVTHGLTVQIKTPHVPITKRAYGRLVQTENRNQEWRLIFHWVKSKIEAVMWNVSTIEKEFLSEIAMKLPDGRSTTVGEVVLNLVSENRLESLPFIDQSKVKEEMRMVNEKVVEGEVKE